MFKRLTLLLSIFVPAVSCAQSSFTTVTGVVQDPLANVYQNGTFSVNFFDPGTSGKQPLLPGNQPFQTQYSGSLDSFGAFSVNLPDNGVIATASGATGTTWQFFMCANPGILRLTTTNPIPCFSYSTPIVCATNTPTTCTSGSINITAQLKAVAAYLPVLNATAAAKPILPYNPIQYVSQNGSDANDGLSWGTSKATVYAALLALPGGGSGVSGSGTVFVGPLAATNLTANAGIWLMGPLDPNYASPPAGWLKCDTCTVSVVGVGTTSLGYANEAPTVPITGGGTADRNHPAIWLSGLNQRFTAQNIAVSGSQRPIVIGECSNNSRTGCLAFGTLLDKVSASVTVVNASSGPSIDLANTTFVTIKNGSCHGSAGAVAGHTADNAANVLQVGGSLFMQNEELFKGGVKVTGTQIADYIADVDEYGDFTNIMPPVVWFTNYSTLSDAVLSGITGQCISCGSAASDLFNRANENPIASPWIAPGANPLPRLFSNTMTVASTAIQSDLALYSGITWPNDQYHQSTITQLKQGAGYIGWVLRCDASGQNYYYVNLDASPSFGGIGLPTPLNLQKVVAGVLQGPPYAGLGFVTPQIGDIFKVQIIGNQISVFQNGTLVATYADNTSPITSGSAGMFLQSASGISAITDVAIDNWAGGSTVPAPSIQVDGASPGTGPVLLGGAGTSVVGPALMLTDFPYYYAQATNKAISQRQTGFINRYMLGETDVARRIAGFLPVRFANKADTNSANWTSPSNTITLAQTDPFGGTGAAKFHTTTTPGSVSAVFGATAAYTPAINDWIVGGAWIKGGIASGVALLSPGVTFTTQVSQAGIDAGDGNEWTWQYIAYKVAANASATTLQLYHPYFSTGDIYLYGPVLYVLPAASVSDDEALWFANTASSIDTSCAVGNICNVSGHPLQVVGLTSGNCVQAGTGGVLTTTSSGCGSGGTVTSVSAGNLSPLFTTSVATSTTTPAITYALTNQNANLIYAGPSSGGAAAPSFRSLVAADVPASAIPPTAQVFSATTLGGDVSVSATSQTDVMTRTITMPSSGCPCRVLMSYSLYITTSSSGVGYSAWVNDGSANMAGTNAGQSNGSSGALASLSYSGYTTVTYTNGTAVTFTLRTEGDHTYTVRAASQLAGSAPNSSFQVTVFTSN